MIAPFFLCFVMPFPKNGTCKRTVVGHIPLSPDWSVPNTCLVMLLLTFTTIRQHGFVPQRQGTTCNTSPGTAETECPTGYFGECLDKTYPKSKRLLVNELEKGEEKCRKGGKISGNVSLESSATGFSPQVFYFVPHFLPMEARGGEGLGISFPGVIRQHPRTPNLCAAASTTKCHATPFYGKRTYAI